MTTSDASDSGSESDAYLKLSHSQARLINELHPLSLTKAIELHQSKSTGLWIACAIVGEVGSTETVNGHHACNDHPKCNRQRVIGRYSLVSAFYSLLTILI